MQLLPLKVIKPNRSSKQHSFNDHEEVNYFKLVLLANARRVIVIPNAKKKSHSQFLNYLHPQLDKKKICNAFP